MLPILSDKKKYGHFGKEENGGLLSMFSTLSDTNTIIWATPFLPSENAFTLN